MKQMKLHQDAVTWKVLGLEALNVHTGRFEDTTSVPTGKFVGVKVADKSDAFDESTIDEVSLSTSEYAMRHGKKRDYVLFKDGRAIGWATFHREERPYKVTVEVTYEDEVVVWAKSEKDAMRKAENNYAEDYAGMYNAPVVVAINAERND